MYLQLRGCGLHGLPNKHITAQAELFANGDVELRYGQGSSPIGDSFVAGIEDDAQGIYAPVSFASCSLFGICSAYPANQGLRFRCKF